MRQEWEPIRRSTTMGNGARSTFVHWQSDLVVKKRWQGEGAHRVKTTKQTGGSFTVTRTQTGASHRRQVRHFQKSIEQENPFVILIVAPISHQSKARTALAVAAIPTVGVDDGASGAAATAAAAATARAGTPSAIGGRPRRGRCRGRRRTTGFAETTQRVEGSTRILFESVTGLYVSTFVDSRLGGSGFEHRLLQVLSNKIRMAPHGPATPFRSIRIDDRLILHFLACNNRPLARHAHHPIIANWSMKLSSMTMCWSFLLVCWVFPLPIGAIPQTNCRCFDRVVAVIIVVKERSI